MGKQTKIDGGGTVADHALQECVHPHLSQTTAETALISCIGFMRNPRCSNPLDRSSSLEVLSIDDADDRESEAADGVGDVRVGARSATFDENQ